jgi:lipoprotein-releasing system permease protein
VRILQRVAVILVCACGSSASPPAPKQTAQPAGSNAAGSNAGSADPWHSDMNAARDLRDTVIAVDGHITVVADSMLDNYRDVMARLEKLPDVVAAEPFSYIEVLLASTHQDVLGVAIKGVDPQRVAKVLGIGSHMVAGSVDALAAREPSLLIGAELAATLQVHVGDQVTAHTPALATVPAGPARSFRIGGIFKLGFAEFDERLAFAPLSSAQKLTTRGDVVMGIELALTSTERTQPVARAVEAELGGKPYVVLDWYKRNEKLFTTLFGDKRP